MAKLEVVPSGTKVEVKIVTDYPAHFSYKFTVDACRDDLAILLAKHINESLGSELRYAYSAYYANGYKDGRAKRKKRDWFSNTFGWRP